MSDFKIVGSILAAGRSGRMGQNKLIMRSRNNLRIIDQVIDNALKSNLHSLHFLVRDGAISIDNVIGGKITSFGITSEQMADSVRAAIENALDVDASHIMIFLGDMPSVLPLDINALIEAARHNPTSFITAVHGGEIGNPVVLPLAGSENWIDQLSGDTGARKIIEKIGVPVINVECSKGVLIDIDTPEAYAAYLAE